MLEAAWSDEPWSRWPQQWRWCRLWKEMGGGAAPRSRTKKGLPLFWPHQQLLLLQMSNYKRATLEEEDVCDVPGEATSSPDRVEVCTCPRTGPD